MTEIIAENSPFTSDLQAWLAAERRRMDEEVAAVHDEPLFTSSQRARMGKWSLDKKLRSAIANLTKIQNQLRHGVARRATTPRLRRVVRAVRRDRRSPATVRATADSGGDLDPEPPRSSCSLPMPGGAL